MAITKDEAINRIDEWADYLEVNKETDEYKDAIETLMMPVINERLAFDLDGEKFRLKLVKPLVMENKKIELIEIHEVELDEMRTIQKYKERETIDATEAVLAKACDLSIAEASKFGKRDIAVLTCINQVFFG